MPKNDIVESVRSEKLDNIAVTAEGNELDLVSIALIKSLGETLREARGNRFTIDELALKSNISAGRISQIERGIANPSFETLWRLTNALGIPIRALFPADNVDRKFVVRKHERRRLNIPRDGLLYEMLTPNGNGALEILHLDIPSGYDGARRAALSHEGEKFLHILSGELVVSVAGTEWTLHEGDAITFQALEPHFVRNSSESNTRIQIVVTPPQF
jgi:transcriptional regulator with XRE-family HTH domain